MTAPGQNRLSEPTLNLVRFPTNTRHHRSGGPHCARKQTPSGDALKVSS